MALRGTILLCSLLFPAVILACNDAADEDHARSAQDHGATESCQGPEDCVDDELCVAPHDDEAASCVARCSLDDGDVCPVGEYCAAVVGMNGHRDAACVEGHIESQKSWQRCESADACSEDESCVELDPAIGPRCVPACQGDDHCKDSTQRCALHWDGQNGDESGCVQSCERDADCSDGWTCQHGETLSGLCVR